MFDERGSVSSIVLSCLPASHGALAADIRRRGNFPIALSDAALIELTPGDVEETWAAACAMTQAGARSLADALLRSLAEEADLEDSAAQFGKMVALFLLALHQENLPLKRALCGCRVAWDKDFLSRSVEYLS